MYTFYYKMEDGEKSTVCIKMYSVKLANSLFTQTNRCSTL